MAPTRHTRRWAFVLLCALTALSVTADIESTQHILTPSSNASLRILPLGDSITNGYRSTDGNGYRLALLDLLTANGTETVFIGSLRDGNMSNNAHEGHNGATIDQIATYANLSLPLRPNIILLDAGTNDIIFSVDPTTTPSRFTTLLNEAITACPDAAVLVAQIGPSSNSNDMARMATFNTAIAGIVNSTAAGAGGGKHVMNVFMNFTTADLFDGLHPNDVGYAKMAASWMKGLDQVRAMGWIGEPVVANNTGIPPSTTSGTPSATSGPPSGTSQTAAASSSSAAVAKSEVLGMWEGTLAGLGVLSTVLWL